MFFLQGLVKDGVVAITKEKGEGLVADIERMFASRGLRMTANNERQAMIPESATVLDNPNGTAPAFAVEDDRGVLCALPGVPLELKWLFDHALVPVLGERYQLAHTISYRVLKVVGMGESAIDDQIGDLIASSSNPTVGVLAHPGQVDVRIAAKAAAALIEPVELAVRRLLGEHVFGTDDESLEGVVSALLRQRALTVASHEDVTRGMLAEMLLAAAGSAYLEGVVSAVGDDASDASEADDAVAARRVAALRERYGAQVAVAIHGVPARDAALGVAEAGVNLRPGRTSVAVAVGERVLERPFRWAGTGSADRTRTTRYALALLREALRQ